MIDPGTQWEDAENRHSANPVVLLVDNGSLRPAAWRNLTRVAHCLAEVLQLRVVPASVLHSNKIPPQDLDGGAAGIVEETLRGELEQGARSICILPFFIGPTQAVTRYLPKVVRRVTREFSDASVSYAPFVFAGGSPEQDEDLVELLHNRTEEALLGAGGFPLPVVLVDHGSPEPAVTAVRNLLSERLQERLGNQACGVMAASMERRDGPDYAFNEPLLADALRSGFCRGREIVLTQLFLSPGRHAGSAGDIASICAQAMDNDPSLKIHRTRVLGEGEEIIPLLAKRFRLWRDQA